MPDPSQRTYVTRAGNKLAAALQAFGISVSDTVCADLGSHAGGFVDCLLQHGAARVHAVDPGYGILDYRLRKDPRVVVHERTNALRFTCPEPCNLITIDVGWTQQRLILPAARRSLCDDGRIITLVKPQYEAPKTWLEAGIVPELRLDEVLAQCRQDINDLRWRIDNETESPIRGQGGNREFLWLLSRHDAGQGA